MKRAKKHRKRHLLPGPAGLLQQRNNTFENGKVPSPNKRNEQPLAHDEELRSKKQKSNLSHAQIWDAMCLSMDRIVPSCSNLGILRRALPSEYSLLVEVTNAQYLKIKKIVVQIEAIHSHGHSDYTVDLSDESTRLLLSTIPRHDNETYMTESSSSLPIGWLSQSLIQMHPEWIKPGTVMLCHDVTIAVFRSNKGLIDRMILLGDDNVVYAWTEDSVDMTFGEQGKISEDEKYLRLLERRAEVEERLRLSMPPNCVSENGSSCSGSEGEEDNDENDVVEQDHNDILVLDTGSNTGEEWFEIRESYQTDTQQRQRVDQADNPIQSLHVPKGHDASHESQAGGILDTRQEESIQKSSTKTHSSTFSVSPLDWSRNLGEDAPSHIGELSKQSTEKIQDRTLTLKSASSESCINLGSTATNPTVHQSKIVNPYSKTKAVVPETPINSIETQNSTGSMNSTHLSNPTQLLNPYARKISQSQMHVSTATEKETKNQEIPSTHRFEENPSHQTNQLPNISSNIVHFTKHIGKLPSDSHCQNNDLEHISGKTPPETDVSTWDFISEGIDDKDAFDDDIRNDSNVVSSDSHRNKADDRTLISQNAMGNNTSCIFSGFDEIEDCDMDAFLED